MITADGWFDWCERVPGPPDKVYAAVNSASIYLPHSAVGYYAGWISRLMSNQRRPNGQYTPYAAASVHLWFPQDSSVPPKQHYSIFKSCWASGSQYPNTNGVAAENEGGPPGNVSEPLTDYQVGLNTRAIQELSEFRGWQPRRPISDGDKNATLYEHRECKRFGSDPTACPSNRIPWTKIFLGLEDDMSFTEDDRIKINQIHQMLFDTDEDSPADNRRFIFNTRRSDNAATAAANADAELDTVLKKLVAIEEFLGI